MCNYSKELRKDGFSIRDHGGTWGGKSHMNLYIVGLVIFIN
jgi:hypothetical protein